MICPNCGRRNSPGATFCSRCRQRLPLANKIDTNRRRAVIAEPRGGGGSAAVVLSVALLAGFLFIGGAVAIYLSNPPGSANPTNIAVASGSPTLPPFVQPTATPSPSPTFILLPSDSPSFSFSPLPSATFAVPTATPVGPTTPPVQSVVARFNCTQQGTKKILNCQENSTGNVTGWLWDFGDGFTTKERNPSHEYNDYGQKTVKLTVTSGTGATDDRTRTFPLEQATPTPSPSPEPTMTENPTPCPAPTGQEPTPTPPCPDPPA